ncbi:uncharacterized protein G2W53_020472 [Senna tora]|uniref:Uncharacterized protein n=1 Tax=Senna tora TaxID=362788 RepID=A0A834WQ50_9FABA|nr:uncharacterized protein G2W53_020472 [Senna tora]
MLVLAAFSRIPGRVEIIRPMSMGLLIGPSSEDSRPAGKATNKEVKMMLTTSVKRPPFATHRIRASLTYLSTMCRKEVALRTWDFIELY